MARFFVQACMTRGQVKGYGVYDENPPKAKYPGPRAVKGGLFYIKQHGSAEVALHLANTLRDDLNQGIK